MYQSTCERHDSCVVVYLHSKYGDECPACRAKAEAEDVRKELEGQIAMMEGELEALREQMAELEAKEEGS